MEQYFTPEVEVLELSLQELVCASGVSTQSVIVDDSELFIWE